MRLLLTVTVASLLLAGCAGNYDRLADAHLCEPSRPPDPAVTGQLFPSSRLNVPARSLVGGGKLDLDDTQVYACFDPKDNRMNEVPNLHKISLPNS